ncbi:MAG: hypothetical protein ACSHXD_20075 [Marinosulfonomonas sp.]
MITQSLRTAARLSLASLKASSPDDLAALAAMMRELSIDLAAMSFAASIPENEETDDPETNDPTG